MSLTSADLSTQKFGELVTSITISQVMLQKPSSVPLFCQNLITVILFYQVLQNIFLTNSKILQPDLSSKLASMNTSNPSFRNFTGYQQSQESNMKAKICATILSLKVTQSMFLNSWLSTIHPDNFAPFFTPEPSTYLSQKQKPLDNELFLWWARHHGTHYHMMFITRSASTSSFKQALITYLFKSAYN